MSTSIKKVAVVGVGVIGSSWTALFLSHGLEVLVADPVDSAEQRLLEYIDYVWPLIPKTSLADKRNWRFYGANVPDIELAKVDFVQESGPERLDLKVELLGRLDAATSPHIPICSSTSGLVPSSLIACCQQAPQRVLVAHPWNPPHLMPLVELVPHQGTENGILETARHFYTGIGKKPILLRKEVPGFVGNRLQAAVTREAFNLVAEGVCEPEDVERAMLDALGPRWALTGPFMTSILGGGGNPGGYEKMQNNLGAAFASWTQDMDKVAKRTEEDKNERLEQFHNVAAKINANIGRIDTKKLQVERDELLATMLKLRHETPVLNNYAGNEKPKVDLK